MKIRTILAGAAALAGLAFIPAVNANASTTGCTSGAFAGYCGTQQNLSALPIAFDVKGQHKVANTPIIGWKENAGDPATDFFTYAYDGGSTKVFLYAPDGVPTDLCISQPAANAGLILRNCNGSAWQQFTATAAGSGYTWTNLATGQIVTSTVQGGQLSGENTTATPSLAQEWTFEA
jgi:hypothetical protein